MQILYLALLLTVAFCGTHAGSKGEGKGEKEFSVLSKSDRAREGNWNIALEEKERKNLKLSAENFLKQFEIAGFFF